MNSFGGTNNSDWKKICACFPVLNIEEEILFDENADEAIEIINNMQLNIMIEDFVINNIKAHLRKYVAPKFWKQFKKTGNRFDGYTAFTGAVNELYNNVYKYIPILNNVMKLRTDKTRKIYGHEDLLSVLKLITHATLFSQIPYDHNIIINDFYELCLKVFSTTNKSMDVSLSEPDVCEHCEFDSELCQCQNVIENFQIVNRKLLELDLLERLVIKEIITLIHSRIESHIKETCQNTYDVSYLSQLENWLKTVVMSWLSQIYRVNSNEENDPKNAAYKQTLFNFEQKLLQFLYDAYLRYIIDQLFSVVIEYPDSQPIIDDIRLCLPKTDLRSVLTTKLQHSLQVRLLHQGVSTSDILTAFITTIRALRRLDPTGVLLDIITKQVRKYLRSRADTIRCIVTNLIEEGPSELAEELVKGEGLHLDDTSDDERDPWEHWVPDPVDADPNETQKNRRSSDIISMLVNVFGSKEKFIIEYRTLLADRLLSQSNTEKEIRYLELLRVRFGDSELNSCEVMLKDICDSKRINSNLQNDAKYMKESNGFPANALILSAQFWPSFKEESFELISEVKKQFEYYTKGFETLKGNRTLCWKPHLGYVTLEIERGSRVLNLTVSPILANIILHFEAKHEWTVDELCQSMKVPPTMLKKKLQYWQMQGIIREDNPETFVLIENTLNRSKVLTSEIPCEDEEMESALASVHDQRAEELQMFWAYIEGMLTNLESMPLDRIHQMLQMFVSAGPSSMECSLQELRHFLDGKVKEHKLVISGGMYRLFKH